MFKAEIDARALVAGLSDLEKKQFPFALATAINDTAFQDVRPGWRDAMLQVFDRPTSFTLNAVLVNKANKKDPAAEIYLRDEATKGTPPARYLFHEAYGGVRKHKPFENRLISAGIMSASEYAVPGTSTVLDAYGNVPGRVVNAILADVKASREVASFSTPASRRRRERSKKKRGGVYFVSRGDRGVQRGIYERIRTAFGTAVRPVFIFVGSVHYSKRFDAEAIARKLFYANFPRRFDAALARAIASSKRGKG